jgi:hypothetical protein
MPPQFVDADAVVPTGAYPSSCLPFSIADVPRIRSSSERGALLVLAREDALLGGAS